MEHAPYGYRIENGIAVIDESADDEALYWRRFLSGHYRRDCLLECTGEADEAGRCSWQTEPDSERKRTQGSYHFYNPGTSRSDSITR